MTDEARREEEQLRVWWIPQVPMGPFFFPVPTIEAGKMLCEALAKYDAFQFEHKIKPDYTSRHVGKAVETGNYSPPSNANVPQTPVICERSTTGAPWLFSHPYDKSASKPRRQSTWQSGSLLLRRPSTKSAPIRHRRPFQLSASFCISHPSSPSGPQRRRPPQPISASFARSQPWCRSAPSIISQPWCQSAPSIIRRPKSFSAPSKSRQPSLSSAPSMTSHPMKESEIGYH